MPLPFNKSLDLKLIQLVKENPVLYNTTHPKHADLDTREVTWQKIGDVLNRSAVEFAGIQCQIHYGDFQEDKHKPGLIENLNEYLPEQYSGSWGVEKKILKEFRRHSGLSSIDAKYLYTKTARAMPTYGVTFFLVKEQQKGKKKLVPRLLGINAESILRLDEVTKEILQVWPLTQVKTYHAGKSETFVLNFGDYSDKEYSVKTNDAYRIRDILQGYIDIIAKRMEAKFNQDPSEHHVISEDNIQMSQGNYMEHVQHGANKIIQETFVGPSKIISYEPGQSISHGTQVLTVQQMIVTGKGSQQQHVMHGQVPMRHELEFATKLRKLNRLNSSSVQLVTLLTDPSESNLAQAKSIVEALEAEMPDIIQTVQEAAAKQPDEEVRKRILNQLQELCDATKKLSHCVNVEVNPEEASDAAKRIADLSTLMYFSLDPTTKKRGEFCKRSRQSFVQDDKMAATLRRASALAAAQHACDAADNAKDILDQEQEPTGFVPDADALERSAASRLDKLNAAVALYLTAFADPKNIDYSSAVTSMNTINELLPKLAKDGKALSNIKDGKDRQELIDQIKALCDATKKFCLASDPDDHQKMQDAANEYGKASDKLMFTLRRGKLADKQNEIVDLAREAGNKASLLLVKANELTSVAPTEADAEQLDDAGVRCADATRDLVTCAALTAPSIHEAHCQSALTAAAEAVSTAAQQLATTWKPLVEDPSRKPLGDDLKDCTMDLAKALDRLKDSYSGYGASDPKQAEKLKFLVKTGNAKKRMHEAKQELDEPVAAPSHEVSAEDLKRRLADRMNELNAALAALIAATADSDNPDYAAAEQASERISELIPHIVRDGKDLAATADPNSREQLLRELKALCDATDGIYKNLEDRNMGALNSSASKFANTSGKLSFMFNPRGKQEKEHKVLDLSTSVNQKASDLSAGANEMAKQVGGDAGAELKTAAAKLDHAAHALLAATQVSGTSMQDLRCQESLLASADALSSAAEQLSSQWKAVARNPQFELLGKNLGNQKQLLLQELDGLRQACRDAGVGAPATEQQGVSSEVQRLNFVTSAAEAQRQLHIAENELDKPVVAPKHKSSPEELRQKLSDSVAQLNAALAALVAAVADREKPDYVAADEAMKQINHFLPQVVKDGKVLGGSVDDKAREQLQQQLRSLCDATKDIYDCCERGDTKAMNSLASQFANSSGKLSYVFNPQGKQEKQRQILALSSSVKKAVNEMLSGADKLPTAGASGAQLQNARENLTNAADALVTTAQVTAPSMQAPQCQQSLVSSADAVSSAAAQLSSCAPALDSQRRALDRELDKLRAAAAGPEVVSSEVQKLKFATSAAEAQRQLHIAEKELDKPVVAPKHKSSPEELRQKLSDSVAQLNAALAALVTAVADREKPNYVAADAAMKQINHLLPQVVKDGKAMGGSVDDKAREQLQQQLRALCDATKDIYDCCERGDTKAMNSLASKFANSSGKLSYVFNPQGKQEKERQILALSSSANKAANEMLSGADKLPTAGASGAQLRNARENLANAADALVTTAQVTAPSMQAPQCQQSLVSSADAVSSAAAQLSSCAPALDSQRRALDRELDKLRAAAAGPEVVSSEVQRLKFATSAAEAQRQLHIAEKELDKPVVAPKHKSSPEELRQKLSDSVAQLNAALAALVAAVADREKPDYVAADAAMKQINYLLPQVVKDGNVLGGSVDDKAREQLQQQLRALCDATKDIYESCERGDTKAMNSLASQFANSSGKLSYVFNPQGKQEKERQILALSSSVNKAAKEMLSGADKLPTAGASGAQLRNARENLANAADALVTTAQVTAPSMQAPQCQQSLVSSADAVSSAAAQLSSCAPALDSQRRALDRELDKLRAAAAGPEVVSSEVQRLKFATSAAEAQRQLHIAEKELDKPVVAPKHKSSPEELRQKLSDSVAQLNAALAALVTAVADREKPNYVAADAAMKQINHLLPQVVKDGKAMGGSVDDKAREQLQQQLRALCDATKDIYDCCERGDNKAMNSLASKFANSSGKLSYVFNPQGKQEKERQILALSSSANKAANEMLSGADKLPTAGASGAQLRNERENLANAADALVTTAQVTAPSMQAPQCQQSLVSSADAVSSAAAQLSSCAPALDSQRRALDRELDKLRAAAAGSEVVSSEVQRLKFATSAAEAQRQLHIAEKELDKPVVAPKHKSSPEELRQKLSDSVAQLNAALAALVAALAHRDKPNYAAADEAMQQINQLLPQVVKDGKVLGGSSEDKAREQLQQQLRALCDAVSDIYNCCEQGNTKDLNSLASKFANSSGSLSYVFNPQGKQEKERQILALSSSVNKAANEMLSCADKLPTAGAAGAQLEAAKQNLANATDALVTTAQVTAASLQSPQCRQSLVLSADAVSSAAGHLSSCAPSLDTQRLALDRELDRLRATAVEASSASSPDREAQKLQFVKSAAEAAKLVDFAEHELQKPPTPAKQPPEAVRRRLGDNIARLNAALAALVTAMADREHPDYAGADAAMNHINQLLPHVVNDTKALSAGVDDKSRAAMLEELKALCDATRGVCASVAEGTAEDLNNSAAKFAGVSGRMVYVFNPHADQNMEQQILDLSTSACEKTSELLSGVYQLAATVAGEEGAVLDTAGAKVADAANALLTTAQLTSPCIRDRHCRSSLHSSADALGAAAKTLSEAWKPLVQDPRHAAEGLTLKKQLQELEKDLDKLRNACQVADVRSPPLPPVRSSSVEAPRAHAGGALSQRFIDTLRAEEAMDMVSKIPAKVVDVHNKRTSIEERALQQKLTGVVDGAVHTIRKAEDELIKVYSASEVIPALPVDETVETQQRLEDKLALGSVACARLVHASHLEGLDYDAACQSTSALAEIMPKIVQDAKQLRGAMDEKERKAFLTDLLSLFEATKVLIGSAKNDPGKINESAVAYGNRTAKLLYIVSTDVDPAQEKEVLDIARGVGDSASRLAVLGAAAAGAGAGAGAAAAGLCAAGGACADAAGALVYTAKLVAPSIQHVQCQEVLITAADDLSSRLRDYKDTWEPLEDTQELKEETGRLQGLLASLKEDLKKGALIKRKPVEKIVVVETPLRMLACSVLEDAKRRAEQTSTPLAQKHKLVEFANALGQAVKQLDVAYSRSSQAPHDAKKRCNLENAIQNLQVTVLQARPSQADKPKNNIVDVTDYVRDVAEEADKLDKECISPELNVVKEHCAKIKEYADRIINPGLYDAKPAEEFDDDIMEVDHFAEETDKRVKTINSIMQGVKDGKQKAELLDQAARLTESANILRFATKSALATTRSVSLDATLEELTDLEKKIDDILAVGKQQEIRNKQCVSWASSGAGRVACAAARAQAGAGADQLAPAAAAYASCVRPPDANSRSKEHLSKLLELLKTLTMTASRHVATWHAGPHADTAAVTQEVLKELDRYQSESSPPSSHKSALGDADINSLFLPPRTRVSLDQSQIPEKLCSAASKLSMSAGCVLQSAGRPQSLAGAAAAAVDAAHHLAAVAAAAQPKDVAHRQKIEEASKEMSLQTYNVLKTAEIVTQEPSNYVARRKLLDACRSLNDAINGLVRVAGGPQPVVRRECSEQARALRVTLADLKARACCGLGYGDTAQALHDQRDLIQKLSNDEPQSRAMIARDVSVAAGAIASSTSLAAHAAYLLSIAEQNKEAAMGGFVDVSRVQGLSQPVLDTCYRIVRSEDQAKAELPILTKQVQDYQQSVTEAQHKMKDSQAKAELSGTSSELDNAVKALSAAVHEPVQNRAKITSSTLRVIDASSGIGAVVQRHADAPEVSDPAPAAAARSDQVLHCCRNLNNKMASLLREVESSEDKDPMTWVTFGFSRKAVLDMFEALLVSVRENGKKAGILEPTQEELEEELNQAKKSYVQIQLELANKWLSKPAVKAETKAAGEQAARAIISLGEKTCEDLTGQEKEDMQHLVAESKELLADCLKKFDTQKARFLMEQLKSLRKAIERSVVSRVVEDFLEGEEPLADLDLLADAEKDDSKRKYLLERKIAELLAHLGRVSRTARLVAAAGAGGPRVSDQLTQCTQQTELLAPMLVKAAQQRVNSPDDQAAIEHYQKLLAQYAEAIANVRGLCDQSVDPMDFVQTAGETIQKMREETTEQNDPQKCAYASTAIAKLANRVINVGMSSNDVRKDPELQKALKEAKERLKAVIPKPNDRPSRVPDWKVTTAEILRTTGEVESVLGGEMIFKKQQTSDQPIFAAALDLHTAVREWSAKDNEIVAVAKRMAVLMAKLSDYMNTDRKRDLIATAKAIVTESHEVAELARKLAHECTDIRIKTNLLQVCDRIPTISGQLKMLATVKGSSLGHQGSKDDQEDMNMLVGNAQNLMTSVQEVVKAAASASVKIMSERGPRVRWVRNRYY